MTNGNSTTPPGASGKPLARRDRLSRAKESLLTVLSGCGLALAISIALTLWAHVIVCCGMSPESVSAVDTMAPLLGLACSAVWIGSRSKHSTSHIAPGLAGLSIAGCLIVLWFIAWCYLVARSTPSLWWQQGVRGLTMHHLAAWSWALGVSLIGGVAGGWLRHKQATKRWMWPVLCAVMMAVLPLAMQASALAKHSAEAPLGHQVRLTRGMQIRSESPMPDGTTVRLLSFDFVTEPQLRLRLYDADSDDASPGDDINTTWLGQGLDFVLDKLRPRAHQNHREVLCLFNGGFFGGYSPWVGHHEAPIVVDGVPLYNTNILKSKWPDQSWVFGVSYNDATAGRPQFHLRESVSWKQLSQEFQTAISGVRPLRVNGKSLPLAPGIGATGLRCSRTSLGWTADSRHLFLLIVRDADGEAASNRQRRNGQEQTGGWDVVQVQQFWERRGIPHAILLDGGESTQLAYRRRPDDYVYVTSVGYHLSRTLGYWRQRPLRVFVPMLPAAQSHGGVLNYLTIEGPR